MPNSISVEQIDQAVDVIRGRSEYKPHTAIILGSGLSSLSDAVQAAVTIPFNDLPHWPVSTVAGHTGRLVIGELDSQVVFVMQGRIHYYEGYGRAQVTFPIRVMQRLGIKVLILTNAAGAINPSFASGDVMLITDHLNLMGMVGLNPLIGPNLDELGPRFPDMSQAYDRQLCDFARLVASRQGILLREGVYVGLSGPSFETPADLRFLRAVGADAVGMSTVPETIVARHGDMRVMGLSGISNKANLDGSSVTTHEEVLEAGKIIVPKMEKIIRGVLQLL